MAGGRIESAQQKSTSSTDLFHLPDDNEFVELVWENGQIMMQSQSNRARRDTNCNNFQFQSPKFRDQNLGESTNQKTGKYGLMGSVLDNLTATVPSSDLRLDQDDDMVPWLNYDDPLHNNYSSNFLPELSCVTLNDLPHQNNITSVDKKSNFNPTFQGNQPVATSLRSNVSNVICNSSGYTSPADTQVSSSGFSNTSSGIINFSHFSRPLALARGDARNVSTVGTASSLGMEKMGLANKGKFVPFGNEMGSASQPNLLPKMVNTRNVENPETVSREDGVRNDVLPPQVDDTVASKRTPLGEKAVEPVVASSSVCSGNNPEQPSDDQNHKLKRKSHETEDSEDRSEDVEEESVGIRKTAPARGVTGSKRSRAAEVHNLSERRRRDRINEKMRALQELIPNCNKVDKASMLDEAIEYLKALQLQVQIMSMGAGLYMPHMMLPTGIQHVPGHMAHFPPMMGVGMGMGMGMGYMGMMDMNGRAHFHGPRAMPFSGPSNFQMMARPNLPAFGPSAPGIPVPVSRQHLVPISAEPTNPVVNNGFGVAAHVEVPSSAPLPTLVANDQAPAPVKLGEGS